MRRCRAHGATKSQDGYALLLVVFFAALLLITVTAARRNIITEDRREKEVEMIWRGKEYVRGIRLYYMKLHHLPTQLDDLYKPKTGIRFMRQPYKDPVNAADGTWRIIYAGPAGQIIGSLTQPTNPLISSANPVNGPSGPPLAPSSSSVGGAGNPFPTPTGSNSFSSSSLTPIDCQASSGSPANPLVTPPAATLPNTQASQSNTQSSQCQPTADSPSPNLGIAANAIIGVGSKINKRSIMWFKGEKDYLHFEFIWKVETADPATVVPNP
jgi:hypothetical protein